MSLSRLSCLSIASPRKAPGRDLGPTVRNRRQPSRADTSGLITDLPHPLLREAQKAMTRRFRSQCAYPLPAAWAVLALLLPAQAFSAEKPKLELRKGDRIILIGNTLAERMQYYGHFETFFIAGFPELELVFHNLGYSADELTLRPRQAHFDDHGHTLKDEKPDVLIAVFGFNESFAGPSASSKFSNDLEKFIKTSTTTKYNGKSAPQLVLLSPIAHEDLKNPHIIDGKKNNEDLKLYTEAMAELAGKHGVVFVDLFGPSKQLYESAEPPADDQRRPPQRRGLQAACPRARRGPFRPVSGQFQGRT